MGLHVTHNSWQIGTDLPLELIFLFSVDAFNTPTSEAELFQHIIEHLAGGSHFISA